MSNFFEEEKSETAGIVERKEDEKKDRIVKASSAYVAAESARIKAAEAAAKYAKPESYTGNRVLYDNNCVKRQAKVDAFANGKKVTDPYTGDRLLQTKKEAKALYGDNWQKHLAESDHIMPLEKVYETTRGEVWVTTDDIRAAANSDDNIRVVSRKYNNPKRDRTNKEYVENDEYLRSKGVRLTEEGKQAAIRDGELAEASIHKQIKKASVKNMISTGFDAAIDGAINAGATALMMSGVMNMIAVIKGEKDVDEALADTAVDTGKAIVTGGPMEGTLTVVSQTLKGSSSKFLQALSKANVPAKVVTAVIVTGDILKRYGEGEINTRECLLELGDKGINMAAMGYSAAVGQALIPVPVVGAAIGALIGSAVASRCCGELMNALREKELKHQERLRIIAECERTAAQAMAFREELESYLQSYFREYQECFDEAIADMESAFQFGDADGVIEGANRITRKLGGKVNYESLQEFAGFLMDENVDIL